MRKYLAYLRINLLKHLEHRVNNIVWYFYGLVSSCVSYVAWTTVYGSEEVINGLEKQALFGYFFLMSILWYLIGGTMNSYVGEVIKSGELNMYLSKPMHPILQFIFREQGWKLGSLVVITPIFLGLYILLRLDFPFNSFIQIIFFIISVFFGGIIFALWDMIIGMSAFFIQNMMPINRLNRIFYSLMSGRVIPISLMPAWLLRINSLLFFRYTFSFPLEIIFTPDQISIFALFARQIIWVGIMIVLFNIIFKLGVKRYEAYGA